MGAWLWLWDRFCLRSSIKMFIRYFIERIRYCVVNSKRLQISHEYLWRQGDADVVSPLFFSMLWRDWRSCVRTRCAPVCRWKMLLRSSFWLICTVQTSWKHKPLTSSTSEFTLRQQFVVSIINSPAPFLQTPRSSRVHWTFCLWYCVWLLLFLYLGIITDGTRAQSHPVASSLGATV